MTRTTKLLTLFLLLGLSGSSLLHSQTTDIRFVNTGAANVKGSMYVGCDMLMTNVGEREVSVIHDGTTALIGSFYHDARGKVFKTGNDDWADKQKPRGVTISTGKMRFVGGNAAKKRYISTRDEDYNRVTEYISFPNLEIDTDDQVYLPEIMGADARTIVRNTGKEGVLYLASNLVAGRSAIYDASLRVTGNGTDYTVTPGAVVVEKHVKEFRETASGSEATIMIPFATPYTNMRSGYFAGNWVRGPLFEEDRGSFLYPYGNRDADGDGIIDRDQYVIDPYEDLVPTQPYLIRLQKKGSKLSDNYSGLNHTSIEAETAHDKDKFILHGVPYESLGLREEPKQLFAGTPVLSRTTLTGKPQTQNWLVGNSYTSGLNAAAIADFLMHTVSAPLSTDLHIYHHGATAYETYGMWDWGGDQFAGENIPDIHSMSVFMLSVWQGNNVTEKIEIGPRFQIHTDGISSVAAAVVKPLLKAGNSENKILNFVITPENNLFIYDRTSIKFSESALIGGDDYDIAKLHNPSNHLFELYGTYGNNGILQQNALPFDAEKAFLAVQPAADEMLCLLTVENAASVTTEALLLHDTYLDEWQDLRLDESYRFALSPEDGPDRFVVYFKTPTGPTGIDMLDADWYASHRNDELVIRNLPDTYKGKTAQIYSSTGILAIQETILDTPQHTISTGKLAKGVYLLSLEGKTIKFLR